MSARPALAWIGAAAVLGPEAALADLRAHLVAGETSDEWAASLLATKPKPLPTLKETLKRWKARKVFDTDTFDALSDEMKGQAGRLVDVWHTTFTEKVYASLFDAMANGATLPEWIPEAQKFLDSFGADAGVRIFSGSKWSPNYADLVFRNAHSASMAGGRYAEMFSREWIGLAPFWLYDAVDDDRTRPAHAALDGMVFRKDTASARRLLPPSSHRCRCLALEYTQRDVDEGHYRVTDPGSLAPEVFPPRGWDADRVESLVPGTLKRGVM